jgi:Asp/Glu/hydantoin racemase
LRILLINPNTTESVTALVAGHARAVAGDAAMFVLVTGRFGAHSLRRLTRKFGSTYDWKHRP